MKKIFSAIISSPLKGRLGGVLFALLATTSLWAYDFRSGDLYYNITSDTTVKVTYQYEWSSNNYAGLTTVTIPETVTYNDISYSVTSIGDRAFLRCSSLTSVVIPNSVTSIGYEAFNGSKSLISITIGNSVTSIGEDAFNGCSSLTSITIPNSVTSIGYSAFYGTGIYNDESNWENEVLYIDNYLIKATSSISGLCTIKENTRLIADYAFHYCSSLTSITIPNSVTSIGNGAFAWCSALTSITIPNSVTSIGRDAFYDCSSLTSITIPNSVTSIEREAFSGCSSLTSVTIPNSVTTIGYEAFYSCESLPSITIPNSVTSIGDRAFYYCDILTTVICKATEVPELGCNVFEYAYHSEATLYVSAQSLDIYNAAEQWKDFGAILPYRKKNNQKRK